MNDPESLAAFHALGVLEPEEELALRQLGPGLDGMLSEYEAAAAMIALSVEPAAPPPELFHSLKTRIDSSGPASFFTLRAAEALWQRHPVRGAKSRLLSDDPESGRISYLLKLQPGSVIPYHDHSGPEDCYVVAGDIELDGLRYEAGDFLHAPGGHRHGEVLSRGGCTLLLIVPREDYRTA